MAESSLSLIANSLMSKIVSFRASVDMADSPIAKIDSFRASIDMADSCQRLILLLIPMADSTKSYLELILLEDQQHFSTEFFLDQIKYMLRDAENVWDELEYEIVLKKVVNAADVNSITMVPHFFSTYSVFEVRMDKKIKELNQRLRTHLLNSFVEKMKYMLVNAENVLDEFEYEMLLKKVVNDADALNSITKVSRFFSIYNAFGLRMAKKLDELNYKLSRSGELKVAPFILQMNGADGGSEDRRKRSLKNKDFIVDLCIPYGLMRRGEEDKEIIIKLLMNQDPCDSFSVIPIVGMEGIGKTALAHSVFIDQRIDHSFSSKIWVSLSHGFNIRQVIAQIIQCDTDTLVQVEEQHINQLQNILQKQKFLLVLDDVRDMDPLQWEEFRALIPSGMEGSKILVTTRSASIASMMGNISSHYLKGLYMEENKFPYFIKVGREIVNKHGGVPFAIKLRRIRLNSAYEVHQWKRMRDSQFCDLLGNTFLLRLSYHHMPSHLRQCFELFSLYPNDFVFHSSEVASLWAALGLLPTPNKDETFIDVANQCLHELMCKSFLHNFVNFGTSYYFQIHDLVIGLAREMAFCEWRMVGSNIQNVPNNVLHVSFAEDDLLGQSFTSKSMDVRTILFPIEGVGASSEAFLNMCVSTYKYLRILDLSDSTYETLPSSTGKLKHLRFLSLERNEKIKRVPDSICKLYYLQVLNLAGCTKLEKLPKGLRNLISLRQLGITTKEAVLPENDIANLNSLEILNIESCQNLESLFIGIKLPNLRTLTVTKCGSLKSLSLDVNHFPRLETLLVDNCGYLELTKGPDDQSSNLCLKAIHLQSLPQLLTLPYWLQESSNTLLSLLIVDCKNLEVLPEWLSTLTFLGSFSTINCPKLTFLPNDIHRLTALGYLRIEGCPELCRKCQPHVGEYWPKISHISQIIIDEPEDLKEDREKE